MSTSVSVHTGPVPAPIPFRLTTPLLMVGNRPGVARGGALYGRRDMEPAVVSMPGPTFDPVSVPSLETRHRSCSTRCVRLLLCRVDVTKACR